MGTTPQPDEDEPRVPGEQEPAEGSRETVDEDLREAPEETGVERSAGADTEGTGVSEYVPDA
jgi:hypothetical protein